jgi:hypothetical protein
VVPTKWVWKLFLAANGLTADFHWIAELQGKLGSLNAKPYSMFTIMGYQYHKHLYLVNFCDIFNSTMNGRKS